MAKPKNLEVLDGDNIWLSNIITGLLGWVENVITFVLFILISI